jgi:hypothetical protein
MQYLLDACTIINLLHVDEDEFLLKKLSEFEFTVCKSVFEESRKNAFGKFGRIRPYPQEKHDLIEKKLSYFRDRIYSDDSYLELSDPIAKLTNYRKKNGEFFSILLSFYLNTFEKKYILFVTDDAPAKDHFSRYLKHHKIGYIHDCVDLLVFLYRHCDGISRTDLKKYLSSLYSEYVYEISDLEKKLNSLEVPKHLLRNKDITYNLQRIKASLNNFNLVEVDKIYQIIVNDQKKYKFLFGIIEPYSHFFNKNVSTEYLSKIQGSILDVDSNPFFKFCEN